MDQFITKTRSRAGIEMAPTHRIGVSKVLAASEARGSGGNTSRSNPSS